MSWKDLLYTTNGDDDDKKKAPAKAVPPAPDTPLPFPKLNIPVLTQQPAAPAQVSSAPVENSIPAQPLPVIEDQVVEDPQLNAVAARLREKIQPIAGVAYGTFRDVRQRMEKRLSPGATLDLGLVCAAANVSGRDLTQGVGLMEQGLQTAELEVGNEIDSEEREAVAELEGDLAQLSSNIDERKERIDALTQQLRELQGQQATDQRAFAEKQGSVRQKKAVFAASRQRLRAARLRVGQELANEKRTFMGL